MVELSTAFRLLSIPLLHTGTNDVAARSPGSIKEDFRALGRMVNSGAQVVFSSILPVMWKKQAIPIPGFRTDAPPKTSGFITVKEPLRHKVC